MVHSDTNRSWSTWNEHLGLGKMTAKFPNQRKNLNYQDYSFVEIDQNIEKSPGDMERLAVSQISINSPPAYSGEKNSQGVQW